MYGPLLTTFWCLSISIVVRNDLPKVNTDQMRKVIPINMTAIPIKKTVFVLPPGNKNLENPLRIAAAVMPTVMAMKLIYLVPLSIAVLPFPRELSLMTRPISKVTQIIGSKIRIRILIVIQDFLYGMKKYCFAPSNC